LDKANSKKSRKIDIKEFAKMQSNAASPLREEISANLLLINETFLKKEDFLLSFGKEQRSK